MQEIRISKRKSQAFKKLLELGCGGGVQDIALMPAALP